MKKTWNVVCAGMLALFLTACGSQTPQEPSVSAVQSVSESTEISSETAASSAPAQAEAKPTTVSITALDAEKKEVSVEVPYDAQRIAVMDMASLDILQTLGLGDRVVGSSSGKIDYLQDNLTKDSVANLGTVKEADLEAVKAAKPDVIFIGGRLAKSYDQLKEIAPVVFLGIAREKGVVESTKENAMKIAKMFGLESEVDAKFAHFGERIAKLQEFAKGKNAIIGLVTKGNLNVLGNDGRCSLIGKEIGFENLGVDSNIDTSTHGNEASFEFLVEKNPQYIFILDRDAAIHADGAKAAKEIVENELTASVDAIANGHSVYMAHPDVWYIAEGGIHALDVMISDIEQGIAGK